MIHHRYQPMLAKEAKTAFSDKDWIFEVKWDGFRAIAYIDEDVSLRSRNQKELLTSFPELEELKHQPKGTVLDGEIVILNKGKVDFQALLQRSTASTGDIARQAATMPAAYIVFDILEKDSKSIIDLPLSERKKILKETLKENSHVLLADYVEEKGEKYYEAILQKGLEGIMAKKKTSKYEPGARTGSWLKIKKILTCDCIVFGYTKGTGARKATFGALILGLYNKEGKPVFIGKVGTGFSTETLSMLLNEFKKFQTDTPPFEADIPEKVTWLKPSIVCEVGYQVVTPDGRLRMPRFLRLRDDKKPKDCTTSQLGEELLKAYAEKRDFLSTSEPPATQEKTSKSEAKIFVVQEHHARRLHFDFRLEKDGVLKSWAVPKGIPDNPEDKRLAVQVEDHPIDYAKFEGTIPEGQYGAGKVIIWDNGTYETKVWTEKMIEVILSGKRLKGRYALVPLTRAGKNNWLMLKAKD
ncbi:MAG TPA: non-homologous end-joining DNA ligase [Candidatus Nanoarchaeia archaeon]|nr:non-homologous end-joining DNA ligase [Candidatus Nanoarchaeia archaeon]